MSTEHAARSSVQVGDRVELVDAFARPLGRFGTVVDVGARPFRTGGFPIEVQVDGEEAINCRGDYQVRKMESRTTLPRRECPTCCQHVPVTRRNTFRQHNRHNLRGGPTLCKGSGQAIPGELELELPASSSSTARRSGVVARATAKQPAQRRGKLAAAMTESELDRVLGRLLRSERERLGKTQDAIASALDMHRPSITECEAGRRRVTYHEFERWCVELELDPIGVLEQLEQQLDGRAPAEQSLKVSELLVWAHAREVEITNAIRGNRG